MSQLDFYRLLEFLNFYIFQMAACLGNIKVGFWIESVV